MKINCKGNLIDLSTPKVMGILNITPNSFYDGGSYNNKIAMLNQIEKMIDEGATFIDVGAYSTKPNADFVSEQEEIKRIIPVVQLIVNHFPDVLLSIDTFRSEVANQSINEGASIINDIAAGTFDEKMMETISKHQVPYIMMHLKGGLNSMHEITQYETIVKEIIYYFSKRVALARKFGINDMIVDPGFGFSKTLSQNYEVLKKLELFSVLDLPLLVGFSRKSMVYKVLDNNPKEALNGTTVLNTLGLSKGANILRVHDVKQAVETISIFTKFQNS